MRTLRVVALLLVAVSACAATSDPVTPGRATPSVFLIGVNSSDGVVAYQPVQQPDVIGARIDASRWKRLDTFRDDHTCYFIRSYVMKREGETGATHLDHVTTCTPASRFQSKKTHVKFTPAVAK